MRRYTFPSTALIIVLAGSVAMGDGKQRRRKSGRTPIPSAHRVTQIDRNTIEVNGQRFTLPEFATKPAHFGPEPPFPFYRIDPEDGDRNNPLPGGAADVRAVLEQVKPVPADRLRYFAALDRDPRSEQHPRGGWYVYVTKVERQAGGSWVAEIMAGVWFDNKRSNTGGKPMGTCWHKWIERYHWDGQTLTYLGGQPSRPGEVPHIIEAL